MYLLMAQAAVGAIAYWAIGLVVIAAIVGVVLVIARQSGIAIPPFIVTILWILLAAVVGVLAIKFLVGLG